MDAQRIAVSLQHVQAQSLSWSWITSAKQKTIAPCKMISPEWRESEIFAHSTRAPETRVSPLREEAALGRLINKVSFSYSPFMSSAELKEIIDAGHEL